MAKRGRRPNNLLKAVPETGAYSLLVTGQAESAWRGATPESVDQLLVKSPKSIEDLYLKVAQAKVDQFLQAGHVDKAAECIQEHEKKLVETQQTHGCPTNIFKKDLQVDGIPYIGAHAVFGAFRDSAKWIAKKYFYQKGVPGMTKNPSAKHLRKFVVVRPNHIFLHRPKLSMNGNENVIKEADGIEGQQPIGEVKGFAKYEYLLPPFQFSFSLCISPEGIFEKFLKDEDLVLQVLQQASLHGLGAGRSAGYGVWKILNIEKRDGLFDLS